MFPQTVVPEKDTKPSETYYPSKRFLLETYQKKALFFFPILSPNRVTISFPIVNANQLLGQILTQNQLQHLRF